MTILKYKSVFDIIGPIMIGPSSSHTAGAVAIGKIAHILFGEEPKKITIQYYDSFAETHLGHGTDVAIISGILGFAASDLRVPQAIEIAEDCGIEICFIEEKDSSPLNHPNTAIVTLENDDKKIVVSGCSIGGGTIEIHHIQLDGVDITLGGTLPILIAKINDELNKEEIESFVSEKVKINSQNIHKTSNGSSILSFSLDNHLKLEDLRTLKSKIDEIYYLSI